MTHPRLALDRAMLQPKGFYFGWFAAAAFLGPFLPLYYAHIGLSGRQIGLLAGLMPVITLVSAPLWGGLADVTRQHRLLLLIAIAGAMTAVFGLSRSTTFLPLIPLVAAYAFVSAPIIPLVDNAVLTTLGERRDQYGRQRLWGALGWGIAGPVAGWAIDRAGLGWVFYGYLILMAGVLLLSTGLPVARASLGGRYWQGVRVLLGNRQWAIFLLAILIGGISLSLELTYLFLYLGRLGADRTLMGLALAVATVSELPVWFFSSWLLRHWGPRNLLRLSLVACAVQPLAYSLILNPWLALPIQLLHGPAFSAMWAAGVAYANEIAPEGMGATAQGVFSGVAFGLRAALGALVGGLLYDGLGPVGMFRWGAVSALVGLAFFVLASRPAGGHTQPRRAA